MLYAPELIQYEKAFQLKAMKRRELLPAMLDNLDLVMEQIVLLIVFTPSDDVIASTRSEVIESCGRETLDLLEADAIIFIEGICGKVY